MITCRRCFDMAVSSAHHKRGRGHCKQQFGRVAKGGASTRALAIRIFRRSRASSTPVRGRPPRCCGRRGRTRRPRNNLDGIADAGRGRRYPCRRPPAPPRKGIHRGAVLRHDRDMQRPFQLAFAADPVIRLSAGAEAGGGKAAGFFPRPLPSPAHNRAARAPRVEGFRKRIVGNGKTDMVDHSGSLDHRQIAVMSLESRSMLRDVPPIISSPPSPCGSRRIRLLAGHARLGEFEGGDGGIGPGRPTARRAPAPAAAHAFGSPGPSGHHTIVGLFRSPWLWPRLASPRRVR